MSHRYDWHSFTFHVKRRATPFREKFKLSLNWPHMVHCPSYKLYCIWFFFHFPIEHCVIKFNQWISFCCIKYSSVKLHLSHVKDIHIKIRSKVHNPLSAWRVAILARLQKCRLVYVVLISNRIIFYLFLSMYIPWNRKCSIIMNYNWLRNDYNEYCNIDNIKKKSPLIYMIHFIGIINLRFNWKHQKK